MLAVESAQTRWPLQRRAAGRPRPEEDSREPWEVRLFYSGNSAGRAAGPRRCHHTLAAVILHPIHSSSLF